MKCPACGAKAERYAHVCGKCGAPLPETPRPDYGPGVVGASDAETRWAIGGRKILIVIIVLAVAVVVACVVAFFVVSGKGSPESTLSTAYSLAIQPVRLL